MDRIRAVPKFLGLPDPEPDSLVSYGSRSESFHHRTNIFLLSCDFLFLLFVTSLWIFIFEEWCKDLPKKKYFLLVSWRSLTKRAGSGSFSQRHGSADPDPYQNVTDPDPAFDFDADPDHAFYFDADPESGFDFPKWCGSMRIRIRSTEIGVGTYRYLIFYYTDGKFSRLTGPVQSYG